MTIAPSGCPVMHGKDRFDPMSAPPHDELVAIMKQMREETPAFYWDKYDMWVVTEYDAVLEILRDAETFSAQGKMTARDDWYSERVWQILEPTSHRRGSGTMVMGTADGDDHNRLRDPFKRAFQPRSINGYADMVREVCEELVAELRPLGRAEWLTQFAKRLPMRVILDVLGLPQSDALELGRWSDSLMDLITRTMSPELQESRAHDVVACEQYMRDAMKLRRESPGTYPGLMDDVLQSLADGSSEPMSEDELVASWTLEMLIGGHETTASSQVASLRHVLTNRDLWDTMREDPTLIPEAVEEFLRVEPPTYGFFRHTTKETIVSGATIPAGAQVYWLNFAANHDGSRFDEPDEIQIGRVNSSSHISFGKGVHNCLGAPLARLELRIAYEVLTEQLPDLRLAPDQGELEYVPSLRMRVPTGLMVEWDV